MCLLDFEDYKEEMDQKLKEKFIDTSGEEKAKYIRCTEKELRNQWKEINLAVEEGRNSGYISPEDAKLMILD